MAIVKLNTSTNAPSVTSDPIEVVKTVDVNADVTVGDKPPIIPEFEPTYATKSIPILDGETNAEYLERLKAEILTVKSKPLHTVDLEYDGIQILNKYNPVNITNGELSLLDLFVFVKNTYGQINGVIGANDGIYRELIDANGLSIQSVYTEVQANTGSINTVSTELNLEIGRIEAKVDTNKQTTDGEISTINQLIIDQEGIILSAVQEELDSFGNYISLNYATLTVLNDSISSLVGRTEFNNLGDVVSINSSSIVQLSNEIALLVTQEDFDGLGNRVSANEASILINANAIALKVEQTEFDVLSGEVTTNTGNITITSNRIDVTLQANGEFIAGVIVDDINNGTVTIAANKINIDGTTTFSAGYNPYIKNSTFILEPTTPYSKGDTWINNGLLYTSQADRLTGSFIPGDWIHELDYSGDQALNDFIANTYNPDQIALQADIDGKVEYWFQDADPTLDPEWGTDEDARVGDTWYSKTTKIGYNRTRTGVDPTYSYQWERIQDIDALDALDDASEAQLTANSKRRVFLNTPVGPYDAGDLWMTSTNPSEGDLYKCITSNAAATYVPAHWAIATKYTDDTAVEDFITNTYDVFALDIQDQVDGKIEYWYTAADPQNEPTWGDPTKRVDDIWFNTATTKSYRFNGTGWDSIEDSDINQALLDAAAAEDLADGKRRVFLSQPTTPYNVGDLWIDSTAEGEGDLFKCTTELLTGSYVSTHWRRATKYTDDTESFKKSTIWRDAAVDPSTIWEGTPVDHVGDVWYTNYDFGGVIGIEIQPHYWDETSPGVYDWILDVVKIDGGRMNAGSITADKIVVDSLFAEDIYSSGAKIGGVDISPDEIAVNGIDGLRLGNVVSFSPTVDKTGVLIGEQYGLYKMFIGNYTDNLVFDGAQLLLSGFPMIGDGNTVGVGELSNYFEVVNRGQANEYLKCKIDFASQGEIVAYTADGYDIPTIWDSMRIASATHLGGIKVGANLSIDGNGVLSSTGGGGASDWSELTGIPSWLTPTTLISFEAYHSHDANTIREDSSHRLITDIERANWNTAYNWGDHSGLYLGAGAKAVDSDKLDNLDSSQFLRSDVDDYKYGKTWFNGAIDGQGSSGAIAQFNGFIRTGSIYLHTGGNTPDNIRNGDYLQNTNGDLQWYKAGVGTGKVYTTLNDGSGSGLDADTLDTYHASSFPRKAEDATITGLWSFNDDIQIANNKVITTKSDSTGVLTGIRLRNAANTANHTGVFLWQQQTDFYVNGAYRARLNSTGLKIGDNGSPTEALDVVGNAAFTGDVKATNFYSSYNWTVKTNGFNCGVDGLDAGLSFYNGSDSSARIYRSGNVFYIGARAGSTTKGFQLSATGAVGLGVAPSTTKLLTLGGGYTEGDGLFIDINSSSYASSYFYNRSTGKAIIARAGGTTGEIAAFRNTANSTKHWFYADGHYKLSGNLQRTAHNTGTLEGSYNNVGVNGSKTNPIYIIGSSYKPNDDTLSNMYGIGYAHGGQASYLSSFGSGWGMYVASAGIARIFLDSTNGNISATGEVNAYVSSDARLKENVLNLINPLVKLKRLRPVNYNWTAEAVLLKGIKDGFVKEDGLIAQEVEDVIPHVVGTIYDKYKSINYQKIIPTIIGAVQVIDTKVDNNTRRIEELERENRELKRLLNK